ncbi:ECF-type sigma factor [Planctomycetaceae bacterium SH139]
MTVSSPTADLSEDELSALVGWLRIKASEKLQRLPNDATLQTTVLLNETFIKLLRGRTFERNATRAYRYTAAARALREVFATAVRSRNTAKRGVGLHRVNLLGDLADPKRQADFSDLHEAVESLSSKEPRAATVVDLKFYAGLTIQEIAKLLEVSESTVEADWRLARKFILRFLTSA